MSVESSVKGTSSNTSSSVAVAALFLTFSSLFVLIGAFAELYGAIDIERRIGRPVTSLMNARVVLLFALPVAFSLLGLVAAVGLFRSREWGRRATLFLATFPLTVYSLLVIYRPAFMDRGPLASRVRFGELDLGFAACVYALVLFIPLSLWWFILLTRRGIRSQFK